MWFSRTVEGLADGYCTIWHSRTVGGQDAVRQQVADAVEVFAELGPAEARAVAGVVALVVADVDGPEGAEAFVDGDKFPAASAVAGDFDDAVAGVLAVAVEDGQLAGEGVIGPALRRAGRLAGRSGVCTVVPCG
jgi:hypothetical protein